MADGSGRIEMDNPGGGFFSASTSGSALEGVPAAVFSTYGPNGYAHWFVKFHISE